jgi:tetratricopeptide (TPR) repeat protein
MAYTYTKPKNVLTEGGLTRDFAEHILAVGGSELLERVLTLIGRGIARVLHTDFLEPYLKSQGLSPNPALVDGLQKRGVILPGIPKDRLEMLVLEMPKEGGDEELLGQANALIEQLDAELTQAREQYTELRANYAQTLTAIAGRGVQSLAPILRETVALLRKAPCSVDVNALQQQIQEARRQYEQARLAAEGAQQTLREKVQYISTLEQTLATAQKQLQSAQQEYARSRHEGERIRQSLAQRQTELERVQQELVAATGLIRQISEERERLRDDNGRLQLASLSRRQLTPQDISEEYFLMELELGRVLLESGRVRDAIPYLEHVTGTLTESGWAHNYLGEAYLRNGNYGEGERTLERALQIPDYNGSQANARSLLQNHRQRLALHDTALQLTSQGNLEGALSTYWQILGLFGEDRLADFEIGKICLQRKDYDNAVIHFRRTTTLIPDSPWSHMYLGMALLETGQRQQARTSFDEALKYIGTDIALKQNIQSWMTKC